MVEITKTRVKKYFNLSYLDILLWPWFVHFTYVIVIFFILQPKLDSNFFNFMINFIKTAWWESARIWCRFLDSPLTGYRARNATLSVILVLLLKVSFDALVYFVILCSAFLRSWSISKSSRLHSRWLKKANIFFNCKQTSRIICFTILILYFCLRLNNNKTNIY